MSASVEVFALRAAVEALLAGDARVEDDGAVIRWDEPICDPFSDRLVGVFRCEGGWAPLVAGQEIMDGDEVVGYLVEPRAE